MSNCKHVFMGTADGVECQKCHKIFSAREYSEYLLLKKDKSKEGKELLKQFESDELPSEAETAKQNKTAEKKGGKKDERVSENDHVSEDIAKQSDDSAS